MIISRWILLRKRNVSHGSSREIKAHSLDSITFSENRAVYENVEKYGRAGQATDDNITRCMQFAGWITKVTKTPSEYKILVDFPLQQWFLERASMSSCTYIASLVWELETRVGSRDGSRDFSIDLQFSESFPLSTLFHSAQVQRAGPYTDILTITEL
jgi:hypothetical protein